MIGIANEPVQEAQRDHQHDERQQPAPDAIGLEQAIAHTPVPNHGQVNRTGQRDMSAALTGLQASERVEPGFFQHKPFGPLVYQHEYGNERQSPEFGDFQFHPAQIAASSRLIKRF